MAGDFWAGYTRDDAVMDELVVAVTAVMARVPKQRLGQIIANAIGGHDLFNIHDEDLMYALDKYGTN